MILIFGVLVYAFLYPSGTFQLVPREFLLLFLFFLLFLELEDSIDLPKYANVLNSIESSS